MTDLYKYPKTYHLPWSPGLQNDDRKMKQVLFEGKDVVVTEKLDGENTTMYTDHIHARSMDSVNHPSRNWVKAFWGSIKHDIPSEFRICGENMYALHSIPYDNLDSFFYGFSIWSGNTCLDWDTTLEWFKLLGIVHVPVLYRGPYHQHIIDEIQQNLDLEKQEGYVVRLTDSFWMKSFQQNVGKYVRAKHVQTDELWMLKPVVPNKLKEQI